MEQSYSQVDLRYVERAICMEEFYIHNPGKLKFYIPTLTPFESGGKPKESPVKSSKSHLLNKNKSVGGSGTITKSNYMVIDLPNWITAVIRDIEVESECTGGTAPADGGQCSPGTITNTIKKLYFFDVDDREYVSEGKEFLVAFIGGDLSNPQIIGRYKG